MATCPNCEAVIEFDEEDLDEGDTLTCDECGADISVTGLDPLELETSEDEDEEEEDDDEDPEYVEDEDEEEEEKEEEEDY